MKSLNTENLGIIEEERKNLLDAYKRNSYKKKSEIKFGKH
jgi:hypothetical protein